MTRLLRTAAAAAFVAACAGPAAAEALPESARRKADETFSLAARAEALYEDLDVVLRDATEPVDLEPLAVRDLYWRPAGAGSAGASRLGAPVAAADPATLVGRRFAWLRRKGLDASGEPADYPLPAVGEPEPYPRITALVVDRLRRERRGLPDAGSDPLAAEEWAQPLVRTREKVFYGTSDEQRTPEEREVRARRARAGARNRAIGLGAVGLLVVLGLLVHRAIGRPADEGPADRR